MDLPQAERPESDPFPARDEIWRVFVRLRRRPGMYEREVWASGPLEAERAALADREVLATLGSQSRRRRGGADGPARDDRSVERVGRRFVELRHRSPSGSSVFSFVPATQVLSLKHKGEGTSSAGSGSVASRRKGLA